MTLSILGSSCNHSNTQPKWTANVDEFREVLVEQKASCWGLAKGHLPTERYTTKRAIMPKKKKNGLAMSPFRISGTFMPPPSTAKVEELGLISFSFSCSEYDG